MDGKSGASEELERRCGQEERSNKDSCCCNLCSKSCIRCTRQAQSKQQRSSTGSEADAGGNAMWKEWQGNLVFFCNGRLVAGPHWHSLLGTATLIIVPNVLYLAFVAWEALRPRTTAAIFAVAAFLAIFSLLQLFLTGCKDPGVIPRQPPPSMGADAPIRSLPRTREVSVPSTGRSVTVRWNDSTNFYQPPRAHHCSVNDDCIERFDHHCPWVGTTIGRRNYRNFLLFVYGSAVMCTFVFVTCIIKIELARRHVRDRGASSAEEVRQAMRESPVALAVMGIAFFGLLFTATLGGFHAYLISTNQTTYENFRYNFDSSNNPYNRGLMRNCLEVWCMDASARNVDFSKRVREQSDKPVPALLPVQHLWNSSGPSQGPSSLTGGQKVTTPANNDMHWRKSPVPLPRSDPYVTDRSDNKKQPWQSSGSTPSSASHAPPTVSEQHEQQNLQVETKPPSDADVSSRRPRSKVDDTSGNEDALAARLDIPSSSFHWSDDDDETESR